MGLHSGLALDVGLIVAAVLLRLAVVMVAGLASIAGSAYGWAAFILRYGVLSRRDSGRPKMPRSAGAALTIRDRRPADRSP